MEKVIINPEKFPEKSKLENFAAAEHITKNGIRKTYYLSRTVPKKYQNDPELAVKTYDGSSDTQETKDWRDGADTIEYEILVCNDPYRVFHELFATVKHDWPLGGVKSETCLNTHITGRLPGGKGITEKSLREAIALEIFEGAVSRHLSGEKVEGFKEMFFPRNFILWLMENGLYIQGRSKKYSIAEHVSYITEQMEINYDPEQWKKDPIWVLEPENNVDEIFSYISENKSPEYICDKLEIDIEKLKEFFFKIFDGNSRSRGLANVDKVKGLFGVCVDYSYHKYISEEGIKKQSNLLNVPKDERSWHVEEEDIEVNYKNYIIEHDLLTKRVKGGGGRVPQFEHPMIINFFKGSKRSPKEIASIKSSVKNWFAAQRKDEVVKELGLCDLSDEGIKIPDNKKQLELKTANVLKKDKYKNIEFDLILKSSRGVIGKTGQDGLVKHQENYDEKLPTNTLVLITFDLVKEYEDFINPPKKGEKGSKKGDTMYHQRINNSLTTNLYIEPLDPRVEPE